MFSGDGFFGYNPTIGGNRPQIKIKKKIGDGKGYETEQFGVPEIENIEFKRKFRILFM